ncbi:hypothetical protein LQ953_09200 [Sphingomonas sp. IC-56]|uniref:hypothetical protein n=1 Tax=Sphingomonas sp. IC-56 TaxID=2898529 RepID=UPI001E29625C|nr:hypothetical protein [Sphingomonas sp. IC-56]MCD2324186.1 hypothetical protein [Sphingomonas sp. IC-56]
MAATLFDGLAQLRLGDLLPDEPAASDGRLRAVAPSPPPHEQAEQGSYVPFASVTVRHGFHNHADGGCNDLAIEPTPETRRRLRLFGLLARTRIGGIDLLWDAAVRTQAQTLLAEVATRYGSVPAEVQARLFTPPLLFTCRLLDPRFANFTDLPTGLRIGDPPLLLSTRRAAGSALALDWRRTVRRQSLLLQGGMEQRDSVVHEPDPDAEDEALPALHPADRERQALYARSQCFALLEFHLVPKRALEGSSDLVFDPAPADGRTFFRALYYTLNFAPRPTRWRYLIAARSGTLAPETLRIVTRDGEDAGFVLDDAPATLPDGRPAARLCARDPRPLLARPQAELRLEGKPLAGRVRTRTLVERLPGPTAERILPAGQAPPWSDIYVFL